MLNRLPFLLLLIGFSVVFSGCSAEDDLRDYHNRLYGFSLELVSQIEGGNDESSMKIQTTHLKQRGTEISRISMFAERNK